jgi:hypothetical protein
MSVYVWLRRIRMYFHHDTFTDEHASGIACVTMTTDLSDGQVALQTPVQNRLRFVA